MDKVVTIEIGDRSYEVDLEVFRRLVTTTQNALLKLKRVEGSTFPDVDKKALKFTFDLQRKHSELI